MIDVDALSFKEVYKRFGATYALHGVTFTIPRKVVAGLLGPNGAGKTTSIKLAVGLLKRNKGEVEVLGFDPWREEVKARMKIGVLHEKPVYPPDVKVSTLLLHLAKLRGSDWREVKRVVGITGLKEYLNIKVKALSRGYLQRLGLAQALLGDPELLLLDEPTANLDPIARMEILELIKNLQKELNVTVIISSHILPELQRVCNYAVFIGAGRILDYGSMGDLASRYGVGAILKIYTVNPRLLASSLVQEEYVEAVEIHDSFLKVRTRPGHWRYVEKKALELGAERVELSTAKLEEMYKAVVKYAA